MADELDPVTQEFLADVEDYVSNVERARDEAVEFAGGCEAAKEAAAGMRDGLAEAGAAAGEMAAGTDGAKEAVGGLRDKLAEAAAALKITRDEEGKFRDSAGEVITATELQAAAMKHLRDQTLEAAWAQRELGDYQKKGLLSRLFSGGSGSGSGGGEGGLGLAEFTPGIGSPQAVIGLLAAVEAAGMIIGPEVGALVTGLSAATLGIGAFAALAYPTFKTVAGAIGDNASQLAKLPRPIRDAVEDIQHLKSEYDKMSQSFQGPALKILNDGIGIAAQLLPYVGQFAQAAAPAIGQVVSGLAKFVSGGEFRYFMGFLESLSGPSITAIGSGVKGLAERLMSLMEMFSKKDVINSINIAFRLLGFTLQLLQGLMLEGMDAWDLLTEGLHNGAHIFDNVRHEVAAFGHGVAETFDTARHDVAEFGHGVARDFDDVRHNVAEAGHDIANTFDTVRHDFAEGGHDIAHVFDDVRGDAASALSWIGDHWRIIVAYLVDPVNTAVYELRTHWRQVTSDADRMRHDVASILDGSRHDIASWADAVPKDAEKAWDDIRHETASATDWLEHEIESAFDSIRHEMASAAAGGRHDVASGWDGMLHDAASAWDGMRHEVASGTDDVLHVVGQVPGDILRILEQLPGEMENAGVNAVDGLLHGIESAAGAVLSEVSSLAHDVESYFTDPLKILSPSRVMFEHGVNYVQGIINGIRSARPQLQAAVHDLGAGMATGGAVAAAAGGVSPVVHVSVPVQVQAGAGGMYSSPEFQQYLQAEVQEAILRFSLNNSHNGLALPGRQF